MCVRAMKTKKKGFHCTSQPALCLAQLDVAVRQPGNALALIGGLEEEALFLLALQGVVSMMGLPFLPGSASLALLATARS